MSYEGHVENGVVVFDQPIALPDGTAVRIEVIALKSAGGHFLRHYQDVIGTVTDRAGGCGVQHRSLSLRPSEAMKAVFANTSFYVALLSKRDSLHLRAIEFLTTFEGSLVTTEFVLIETANFNSR